MFGGELYLYLYLAVYLNAGKAVSYGEAAPHVLGQSQGKSIFSCLPDCCWLQVGAYPEGPAFCQLDTSFWSSSYGDSFRCVVNRTINRLLYLSNTT